MKQAYVRGYVLHPVEIAHESMAGWEGCTLSSGYAISYQRKTEVYVQRGAGNHVVAVIGRAFDYDNIAADTREVAQHILELFEIGGSSGCLEYIAYLGGRFACFLCDDQTITAIPDCHATYSIYSAQGSNGTVFASHWQLAAQILNLVPSKEVKEFMRSPDYVEPGGKYYPGTKTPFDGVTCVFANCFARFRFAERSMDHIRFYPSRDLQALNIEEAKELFVSHFEECLTKSVVNGSLLGLTAGLDSISVLSGLDGRHPSELSAFTYVKQANPDRGQLEDLFGANRAAFRACLPHRIFEVLPNDYENDFQKIYIQSFAYGARYPALARAFYENLPHDKTIVISLAAETGTVFYRLRDGSGSSPEALAAKHTQSQVSRNPILIKWMEEYISYTDFTTDHIFNFEWEDLFYWEHRNTKWAALWYSEIDMTGFAIVPFNSRKLIEIMLAVPIEHRKERTLQKLLVERSGLMT